MLRRSTGQCHQFPHTKAQAKAALQVALNHAKGEPALLPEYAYFALHRDAEALPSHGQGAPIRLGGPPLAALPAGAFQHHVFGHPRPQPGDGYHLTAPAHPPALQGKLAIGTTGRGVLHPVGGLLPPPGKAVGTPFTFCLEVGRPVGLDPRGRLPLLHTIRRRTGGRLLLAFQLRYPRFQSPIMTEELTNKFNQLLTGDPG